MASPLVGIIMGSKSDWEAMRQTDEVLTRFGIEHECRIMSAHRTPALVTEYATTAVGRGLEVIVAGAGGAAHLAGVVAANTVLPVIGVPMQSSTLNGLDSLLSTVQMPKGIPVATVAIGASGAANAGLLAVAILATSRPDLRAKLQTYRTELAEQVKRDSLPERPPTPPSLPTASSAARTRCRCRLRTCGSRSNGRPCRAETGESRPVRRR